MFDATFLDEGDELHVGVLHSDGQISLVHVSRENEELRIRFEPAIGHGTRLFDASGEEVT